jgi:hypothetical protein
MNQINFILSVSRLNFVMCYIGVGLIITDTGRMVQNTLS